MYNQYFQPANQYDNGQAIANQVASYIQQNANRSTIRNIALQWLSANGWNNQPFNDLVALTNGLVARITATGVPAQQAMYQAVEQAVGGFLWIVYTNTNPQLPYNEQQELTNKSQSLLNWVRAVVAGQIVLGANQPVTGIHVNNVLAAAPNTAINSAAGGYVATSNTSTAGYADNGAIGFVYANKKRTQDFGQETTVEAEATTTPVTTDPANRWKVVPLKDNQWKPSEQQRYQLAHNPRDQEIVYSIDVDGNTKQEVLNMEYNQHALQTAYTHAEFERERDMLQTKYGRKVDDNEVEEVVNRILPTGSEFAPPVKAEIGDVSTHLFNFNLYANLLRMKYTRKHPDEFFPDVMEVNYALLLPLIADKPDDTQDMKEFAEDISKAGSFDELAFKMKQWAIPNLVNVWTIVDSKLTEEFNYFLNVELGIKDMFIESFTNDYKELVQLVTETYGELYAGNLSLRKNYFGSKFLNILTDEKEIENAYNAVYPYTDEEVTQDDFVFFNTVNKVYIINQYSHDLEFKLEVGQSRAVNFEVSRKMRGLAEEVLDTDKSVYRYYFATRDGQIWSVVYGVVDKAKVVYYRHI